MIVELESSIEKGPMASMRVYGYVAMCGMKGKRKLITQACRSYDEFCESIDLLVRDLNALKPMAKTKFDEFKR